MPMVDFAKTEELEVSNPEDFNLEDSLDSNRGFGNQDDTSSSLANQREILTSKVAEVLSDSMAIPWYDEKTKEEKRKRKAFKHKFDKALQKNYAKEKEFTKLLDKNFTQWKKNLQKEIDFYYRKYPETAFSYLTEDNIDNFIKFYQDQKYLSDLQREEFCELFPEIPSPTPEYPADSTGMQPYQQKPICEKELRKCQAHLNSAKVQLTWEREQTGIVRNATEKCKNDLQTSQKYLQTSEDQRKNLDKKIQNLDEKIHKQKESIKRVKNETKRLHDDYLFVDKKTIQLTGVWLEFVLEVVVWPYATFFEDSFLYKSLKQAGLKPNGLTRLVLTLAITLVWSGLISNVMFPSLIPQLRQWLSGEQKNKSTESGDSFNRHILDKTNGIRGGGPTITEDSLDPIFIEIHFIKLFGQLESLPSQSRKYDLGSKWTKVRSKLRTVRQTIQENRILFQILTAAIIYLTSLQPNAVGLIPGQRNPIAAEHNRLLQSSGYGSVSEWKEPEKTQKIEINSSIPKTLLEPEFSPKSKVQPKTGKRRLKRKKRKQVGRFSDFSNTEFENAEILPSISIPEKTRIRSSED